MATIWLSVNLDFFIQPPVINTAINMTPSKKVIWFKSRVWSFLTPFKMEKIAMKKSRFTEEQGTYALRQAEGGTAVEDICRSLGISQATFYICKKKYGELGAS
jgi:hypothetical protein